MVMIQIYFCLVSSIKWRWHQMTKNRWAVFQMCIQMIRELVKDFRRFLVSVYLTWVSTTKSRKKRSWPFSKTMITIRWLTRRKLKKSWGNINQSLKTNLLQTRITGDLPPTSVTLTISTRVMKFHQIILIGLILTP